MSDNNIAFEQFGEDQVGGKDALCVAVDAFVARSGVAAVETSIADILEGHPLCDVWAKLLENRDIFCVADLYGLETCDLTRIRGIGPAAVADIICAVMARQPWKYRLDGNVVSVASSQEAADDGADCESGEAEPTLLDILGNQALVDALQGQGYATFEEITALTLDEIAAIEGIGDEGALVIDERIEAYLGEGNITEVAPKEELVSHIATERIERFIDATEKAEESDEADKTAEEPPTDDASDAPAQIIDEDDEADDSAEEIIEEEDEAGDDVEREVADEAAETPDADVEPVAVAEELAADAASDDAEEDGISLATLLHDVDCGELVAARLAKEHIVSADDLLGMSETDLQEICDVGPRTAHEVRCAIEKAGFVGYMTGAAACPIAPVETASTLVEDEFCAVPTPKPVEQQPVQPTTPIQSLQPERVQSPVVEQPFQPTTPTQPIMPDLSPIPVQPATYPQTTAAFEPTASAYEGGFDAFAPKRVEPEATYQQPAATTPMPQVAEPQQTAPLPQQGIWTPEGFVADADEEEEIEDDDEEETAIDSYRGKDMSKGKIVLLAGVGVIAVGASLVAGMMLGGVAFADTLACVPYPIA